MSKKKVPNADDKFMQAVAYEKISNDDRENKLAMLYDDVDLLLFVARGTKKSVKSIK